MVHILFVCSHNVFRSMSAEYLFRKYLQEIGKDKEIIIASAGTRAKDYHHPNAFTLNILKEYGCDASKHKATPVSAELLASYDLIICMAEHHKQYIRSLSPKRTILFNELAYQLKKDVLDDGEYSHEYGYDFDLEEFCREIILYIHDAMPMIYQNMGRLFKDRQDIFPLALDAKEEDKK